MFAAGDGFAFAEETLENTDPEMGAETHACSIPADGSLCSHKDG